MGGGYFANDSNNSATHYYLKEAIINHGSRHDVTLHRGRVEVVVARTRTRGVLSLPMRSDGVYDMVTQRMMITVASYQSFISTGEIAMILL